MKFLTLSRELVAAVDCADFDWAQHACWHANEIDGKFYARRSDGKYLHRLVAKALPGEFVDHKNTDTLDCQRENLRRCSNQQNCSARRGRFRKNKTSSFRGVSFHTLRNKWRAALVKNGKQIFHKYFDSEDLAALAYNRAALEHFGEFSDLNKL